MVILSTNGVVHFLNMWLKKQKQILPENKWSYGEDKCLGKSNWLFHI